MLLQTDKIKLRPLEPEDLDMLYIWENDPNIWNVSSSLTPFSLYVLKQYIAESHRDIFDSKQLRLIIEDNKGVAVGAIDLFDFDPNHRRAGIGILIYQPEHRGKSYASHAIQLMTRYAHEILGMHQVYANVSSNNESSLKLFEQCGFKVTGVKKDWLRTPHGWNDEVIYQKILL